MSNVYLVQDGEAKSFIVVGERCSDFYRFVAEEIQRCIRCITGVTLEIVSENNQKEFFARALNAISVGGPQVNGLSRRALTIDSPTFNEADLGAEGFIIKTLKLDDSAVIVLAGGDEAGTMYAAYELLERYGVVFEITGDILPEPRNSLELLKLDVKMKPAFKYRGLNPWGNHLPDCQTWSLDDFKQFIDQCAKMKLNYLAFHFFPFEPWLSYSYKGEKKLVGDYGARETGYTTRKRYLGSWSTRDIQIGKEHFKYEWFCSPELLDVANSEEGFRKAQEKLRQIIRYASRGR